ncbi:PepSY-associated TM helix domain-containing protein [Vulcaniibacterium tengchongense]|uniref:Putative iron-regulated membrane protein n=1 Tax=Vulcaniibacterium tengchongense TaxID=1273429 RepID=A0A3N4VHD5_9GAMM|nr:PepSY-associated TM helix domain-containing protein [Vulcaniibacterium tengchongense]RPE80925.1 putative iron-regulated membrane protein [Vulcaniibacterium tengchongense]
MPRADADAASPGLGRRLRAALSWLHLWAGLSVGTLFALVSLSGTVLVFHSDLLRLRHPQLAQHAPVADAAVLAGLVERWAPQGLRSLDLPQAELPVWQGYFEDGSRALFAPEDGALLLYRTTRDDALLWLRDLHTRLLGGETGEGILGLAGWCALGLLATGLYLWWPKRGRLLAQLKLHAGPPVRRWLTWHRSSGVLLLPLLLLATLTGVGMIYSAGFRAALTSAFGGSPVPAPAQAQGGDAIAWPEVLARAERGLPAARLSRVSVPKAGSGAVNFRVRAEGEWHPVGRSQVAIAADGRGVLQVYDATRNGLGSRASDAIYPLHIGAVGGPAMKWITALAGLLPSFLLVTGFLFWRRRRGHR